MTDPFAEARGLVLKIIVDPYPIFIIDSMVNRAYA